MATKQSHGRIPLALQAVFLASNRGEEVHTPPPGKVAFRMFQSMFQRGNYNKTPSPPPTTTTTTANKPNRRFFGMARNRQRRASTKDIVIEPILKEERALPVQRRASATTKVASFTDRTCPIRDVSFQSGSPTQLRQSLLYQANIVADDISVASSVTLTVFHEAKKKTKKTKKVKVGIAHRDGVVC